MLPGAEQQVQARAEAQPGSQPAAAAGSHGWGSLEADGSSMGLSGGTSQGSGF